MVIAPFLLLVGCWVTQSEMTAALNGKGGEADTDSDTGSDTDLDLGPPQYETARIEAQTFEMGCTAGQDGECQPDEDPVHEVTLTYDFYMDETEVTQGEYARLMEGARPSNFSDCGGDCPVEGVTWHMAAAYANARSSEDELFPFYSCEVDDDTVACSPNDFPTGEGWRLPTEAEWEAAARCGSDFKYAGSDSIDDVSWYDGVGGMTHPVGEKDSNDCGVYDMSGNVWEMVNDWYGVDYYVSGEDENPDGPDEGTSRVNRGGSWDASSFYSRISDRGYYSPTGRQYNLGFRLVRPIL